MPAQVKGKASHSKRARPGDLIVMAGGRIGKDGIHGATFSSESLHAGSPATAVQIGDPITQKKMLDMLLGFSYEPMPKGYNRVVEKDTPALAFYTILFFRKDVADEVVYTLVKAALDHHKEYARVHPLLPEVDAVRGAKVIGAPFHPGAIKYYKEKGVWTAKHEKMNAELLAKYK